jgi:hypothetical protein
MKPGVYKNRIKEHKDNGNSRNGNGKGNNGCKSGA